MQKVYVATIMNRVVLGDNNYFFYVSHPAIGTVDDETGIFTDKNGSEFAKMYDPALLMSEIPQAYYNLQELDDIKEIYHSQSVRDAISDYAFYASRLLYYVTKNENNQVYVEHIDLDDKKQLFRTMVDALANSGVKEAENAKFFINRSPGTTGVANAQNCSGDSFTADKDDDIYDDSSGEEESSLPYHGLTSKEIRSDIASLLLEISEGVYSLSDLKKILENVNTQREDIEELIMSLELQIEASENGESANKLKGEDEDRKMLTASRKIEGYIDIKDLFNKVTKTLIAQDDAVMRVLTEIARKEQISMSKNRGLLITGPTGSGKTKMMELISRYLDRPFFKIDATQLTIPGYVGKDIEEALWELYIKCGKNKDKAEHAIVFIDEIDKKGSEDKGDVSGRGVLNVLLPFIEGTTYNASESVKRQNEVVPISTRNMIVILGGAFEDVYKNLSEKGSIGFGSATPGKRIREATTSDFVDKAKMPDEFMGRVAIIKLNPLDADSIKRILLESDESALKIQERLFNELGVKLNVTDEYINTIAEQACKRATGARGLNTVVDESTWKAYSDAYMNLGEYEEIILGSETVTNPDSYQKVYKKKSGI